MFRVGRVADEDLKAIHPAPNPDAAAALDLLEDNWGDRYPAMIRVWRNAWTEFVPFLDYVRCRDREDAGSTNAMNP